MHLIVNIGYFEDSDQIVERAIEDPHSKYANADYHEKYAQYFTYKMVKNDKTLLRAFLLLNQHQTPRYKAWVDFEHYHVKAFIEKEVL
jgi:hypothetical protein